MNHSYKGGLRRSALTLALGLAFSSSAFAQSAAGSIFGNAQPGQAVTIENLDTGTSRQIATDSNGRFSATQLPTGRYRVTSGGRSEEILVKVGTGTSVNLAASGGSELARVTVTGSAARINPIDVSSVESSSVFTAQQIERLPVQRDVTNVALLAPGTVKGDTGFGNLASFGGSSVAENGYYINGFDVTNIRNFVSYATLPFEAIGEQQIKTGGYGAEFGRSLGGVISLVTKRGTNTWKGGASVYWRPEWGRTHGRDVVSRDPNATAANRLLAYRSDNEASSVDYNVFLGGPIVPDHLFFFGLLEGVKETNDTYGSQTSTHTSNAEPNGIVKIDWNINDKNIVEFTAIRDQDKTKVDSYRNPTGQYFTGTHGDLVAHQIIEDGGTVMIGKYTGYLTDNFTISAQAGRLENVNGHAVPNFLPGGDCVRAYDSTANRSATVYTGCWNTAQTFITDPTFGPEKDIRKGYRLDAEWQLGPHLLRFGADTEKFVSGHAGQTYTGGAYWRHFRVYEPAGRSVNGTRLATGTRYARRWIYQTSSGEYEVDNRALYLEDNWQITDRWLAYLGLRSESFNNKNSTGDSFVHADRKIAPRLGVSWDVNGNSTLKIFANAGRYYIPVASNTNIRASGAESTTEQYFLTTGFDPNTGLPTGVGAQVGPTNVNGRTTPPDPGTVAATNLVPMYQDEFILGFQQAFGDGWTGGARGVYRSVKNGMDDFCSSQAFIDWANDNGYTNFDPGSLASCVIINPGSDVALNVDVNNDGQLKSVNIPARYFGLPKYKRNYMGVELFVEKATNRWSMQASYTWSRSYGNVEGYVNSSLEQDDAGLTQDFDNKVFEDGANGYLPNDRRHVLKAFGAYKLSDEWSVAGNLLVSSGRPVNCLGFAPIPNDADAGTLSLYGASSFYCTKPDNSVALQNRGSVGRTPWTWNFDASVTYVPRWADKHLSLKAAVYNLFNNHRVTEYNETSAVGSATSFSYNPNFLNDVNYQSPRSLELSARYTF